jgi:hypothetical protein
VETDLESLKLESNETEGKSQEEIKSLRDQVGQKEIELSKTKGEMASAQTTGLTRTILGTDTTSTYTFGDTIFTSSPGDTIFTVPGALDDTIIKSSARTAPRRKCSKNSRPHWMNVQIARAIESSLDEATR